MSLALASDSMLKDTEMISYAIDGVYDEMKAFSTIYDYYVGIYNRNINMDLDEFREKDHDYLNHYIHNLFDQQEEIEKFEVRQNIKIVRLDASDMRQRIRQSPIKCWNSIKDFLPKF